MIIPDWLNDITFAFSQRLDGQMSLKLAKHEDVVVNRNKFLSSKGLILDTVVAGELTHGSRIALVTSADAGRGSQRNDWIPGVDGLVTQDSGVLLLTTHADCAPLIVYDPVKQVLGQAHAGWRGLATGVVKALVGKVMEVSQSRPDDLLAWIGPTVRPCCYAVGLDVSELFPATCQVLIGNTTRLNLVEFIIQEMAELDLKPENVTDSGVCTGCNRSFSSFRRDGYATTVMAMVTGLPRGKQFESASV